MKLLLTLFFLATYVYSGHAGKLRKRDIIANVPEPVCHTYGEVDAVCPDKEVRSRLGGGVCNLVSRGFLFNVPAADVAIQNRGGCRADMLEGPLSKC